MFLFVYNIWQNYFLEVSNGGSDTADISAADVVLYGLNIIVPLMNAEILKVCQSGYTACVGSSNREPNTLVCVSVYTSCGVSQRFLTVRVGTSKTLKGDDKKMPSSLSLPLSFKKSAH